VKLRPYRAGSGLLELVIRREPHEEKAHIVFAIISDRKGRKICPHAFSSVATARAVVSLL
jgi:hypothetical protein